MSIQSISITRTLECVRRWHITHITQFLIVCMFLSVIWIHPYHVAAGKPCNMDGSKIPPKMSLQNNSNNNSQPSWHPFSSQIQFETADFLFKKVEMSQADIDTLMWLWAMMSGNWTCRNYVFLWTFIFLCSSQFPSMLSFTNVFSITHFNWYRNKSKHHFIT